MAQDTAHTCTRRAAEGQERTNIPWVVRTQATQPTHRASTPRLPQGYPKATGSSLARLHRGPWQTSPGAMEATVDRRAGTQCRRGSPAKQGGPATQSKRVRRSYRRLAGGIPLVVRDTRHGLAAPRAAAQRRGHVALPMDTCGDTLRPGTHELGGRDNAFQSTCGSGLKGA